MDARESFADSMLQQLDSAEISLEDVSLMKNMFSKKVSSISRLEHLYNRNIWKTLEKINVREMETIV